MPPGFIRLLLFVIFLIHLVPQCLLFLHLNILYVCYFILGLKHGNCVFLFVLLIKVPCFIAENVSL